MQIALHQLSDDVHVLCSVSRQQLDVQQRQHILVHQVLHQLHVTKDALRVHVVMAANEQLLDRDSLTRFFVLRNAAVSEALQSP
jgi:hypothetical protein